MVHFYDPALIEDLKLYVSPQNEVHSQSYAGVTLYLNSSRALKLQYISN